MNLNNRRFKTHALVGVLFLLLAASLAGLMYGYWSLVIQPRLYLEAESNAKILAESQAKMIAASLSTTQDALSQDDIDQLSDQVLVFIDPIQQQPYFLGLSLELDYDVITARSDSLNLSAGDMQCQQCFPVTTALYSQESYELLGVVSFMLNDVFYQKLKADIRQILILESSLALAALFVVWIAVSFFIRRLNQEVKARKKISQQLQLAKEHAEKASQTKSDFLANMSHEIRTPLNAIIGMNYILCRTSLDKRQQDLLKKLDSSAKLLLSLINDLLDFSKIEAGKLELEDTAFKIDEVLNNLAEMVMTNAGEKGIDILYKTSSDIPHTLIGDPLRLGQILLNLMNNAIKFTEQGEILLSVDVVEPLPVQGDKHICLRFAVKDTGIGIKQEDITKLFHSFTQADNSTTRKFGGTGLGLTICKQLVQLMGGEIGVSSTFGEGSTFSFTANLCIESTPEPVAYHLPDIIQHTHVLVVDDNPLAQNIFQHMLNSFGFKVSIATSAQQGIAIVQQYVSKPQPIKLILMDWKMPGMDGMEASQVIKTELSLSPIPAIIMVSAYTERLSNAKNSASWDDYLVKPISQSVLYDAIINIFSSEQTLPALSKESIVADSHPQFESKQVLLAEDNLTNQEVACALMAELNIQVSIANNGKEAVEAVKSRHFDLVFMDLQMPEMDGFTATRLIRQDKNNQHLPIIAMTAHAMQGDREKCLNAQMDDYITKPIDVDKFFTLLDKWLKPESAQQADAEKNMHSNKTNKLSTVLADIKSINIPQALQRMRGKQELLIRLLINFKKQKTDIAKQIRAAIQANDIPTAKALVHSLKGESGTLEAEVLFKASQQLEHELLQGGDQQATYLLQLEQALAAVINDIGLIEQAFSNDQVVAQVAPAIIDLEALTKELRALSALLRDNNLRAKKLATKLTPLLSAPDHVSHWNKVLEALAELDFETAQTQLQEFAATIKIRL